MMTTKVWVLTTTFSFRLTLGYLDFFVLLVSGSHFLVSWVEEYKLLDGSGDDAIYGSSWKLIVEKVIRKTLVDIILILQVKSTSA